jgi:hypothetical protein
MNKLSSAKIFFCFAVLLFVAKPFLGFAMFSRMHPPAVENIFIKAFTKRKLEDPENSNSSMSAIQKKLAEPVKYFSLRFSFLLSIIFPCILFALAGITNRFLRRIQFSLTPQTHSYLLNGKLII